MGCGEDGVRRCRVWHHPAAHSDIRGLALPHMRSAGHCRYVWCMLVFRTCVGGLDCTSVSAAGIVSLPDKKKLLEAARVYSSSLYTLK